METPKTTDPHFTRKSLQQQLVLGGFSGALASIITNPIDVIKVRLQLQVAHGNLREYKGFFRGTAHLIKTEGISSLFAGVNAAVLRAVFYSSTRLGLYEPIRNVVSHTNQDSHFHHKVFAGVVSGAIGATFGNPFEVIKVRMQSKGGYHSTVLGAIQAILRDEGVAGLWRGLPPTIARSAILTASQLASYDQVKHSIMDFFGMEDALPANFMAALVAGLVTTTFTSPVDVIKTRLMNSQKVIPALQQSCRDTPMYRSSLDCLARTVKEEGMHALFKGWVPNYLRLGPHTIVVILIMEYVRDLLGMDRL